MLLFKLKYPVVMAKQDIYIGAWPLILRQKRRKFFYKLTVKPI